MQSDGKKDQNTQLWNTNSTTTEEQYLQLEGGMGWWRSLYVHSRIARLLPLQRGGKHLYLSYPPQTM